MSFNRRQFLKGGLAGAAALLTAPAILKGSIKETKIDGFTPFNEKRYIQESFDSIRQQKRQVFDKWSKVFSFNGLPEDDAIELAVRLENQRLYNEVGKDTLDAAQFKRISIPLIYRAGIESSAREWVSHQTLMGPCDRIFWKDPLDSMDVAAQTRKYKSVWSYEAMQDLRSCHGLDAEAELTAVLCDSITCEADREVATDLRNNARKFVSYSKNVVSFIDGRFKFDMPKGDKYYEIKECVEYPYKYGPNPGFANFGVGQRIPLGRKNGVDKLASAHRFSRWVLTSPEICDEIETHKDFISIKTDTWYTRFGINAIGYIHDYKVFRDPLFPTKQALLGCRFGQYNTGYIMSHYVSLTQTPLMLDPDSFCPRKGILVRYAKRLVDKNMYANVYFKGV